MEFFLVSAGPIVSRIEFSLSFADQDSPLLLSQLLEQ